MNLEQVIDDLVIERDRQLFNAKKAAKLKRNLKTNTYVRPFNESFKAGEAYTLTLPITAPGMEAFLDKKYGRDAYVVITDIEALNKAQEAYCA